MQEEIENGAAAGGLNHFAPLNIKRTNKPSNGWMYHRGAINGWVEGREMSGWGEV